jgi:hypothetical protein
MYLEYDLQLSLTRYILQAGGEFVPEYFIRVFSKPNENVQSCVKFRRPHPTPSLPKNVSGAYMLSARFGKQHIKLVNSILDYTSFFTTGGLTNARNRRFDLYLVKTEDQLFPHNTLRANIVSNLDAGPPYHTQNPRINNDCCDQQQPRGFLGQCIKIISETSECVPLFCMGRARL